MALTRSQLVDPNCEVTNSDYDAIESAIMESSRGRWFLSEYARRNRHADTNLLLSAINNIKETLNHYKRTSGPYLFSTSLSSTFLANQIRRPPTPLPPSQAVPNVADACRNDNSNDSGLGSPKSPAFAKDVFEFNL
jgi:hypothetical protein